MDHSTASPEDYWEDASVSMRGLTAQDTEKDQAWSSHGHLPPKEQPFTARRQPTKQEQNEQNHKCRFFPPPITPCQTTSFKKDARFVLQDVKPLPQNFLLADRDHGRLRLELVQNAAD